MVIDFHYFNGGGGSGSGVTPEEVQEQINSALTPYTPTSGFSTINGSAITEGEAIVIDEPDLTNYWDSAQTESAISAATSGKADAANISAGANFPKWNSQGIITGKSTDYTLGWVRLNGNTMTVASQQQKDLAFYAPTAAGTAGEVLVSTGGTPVWSAVTFISSADVQSQIDTKAADYTPTTGFCTLNGSALTDGSALVIADPDLSNYWDSAATQAHIVSAYTSATTHIEDVEQVAAAALNALQTEVSGLSAASANFVTSAQVETQISAATSGLATSGQIYSVEHTVSVALNELHTEISAITTSFSSYTPTSGFSTINGSAITNGGNIVIDADLTDYWTSAETLSQIDSAYTSAATYIADVERVASAALNELNTEVSALSAANADFVTSAQVETQITSKNYTTSAATATQIATATANMVTSTTVSVLWKGTQAQYDQISPKDPNTLYIIISA